MRPPVNQEIGLSPECCPRNSSSTVLLFALLPSYYRLNCYIIAPTPHCFKMANLTLLRAGSCPSVMTPPDSYMPSCGLGPPVGPKLPVASVTPPLLNSDAVDVPRCPLLEISVLPECIAHLDPLGRALVLMYNSVISCSLDFINTFNSFLR